MEAPSQVLQAEDGSQQTNRFVWISAILLAILWHVLLLWLKPGWNPAIVSPRVEIKQIDTRKLEAIKQQWRQKNEEKQLLLNKDKSLPSAAEAPDDARFMSDRNIRVEKEQQARITNVIPKAGGKPQSAVTPREKSISDLAKLAVPMHLDPNDATAVRHRQNQQKPVQQVQLPVTEGGDQAVLDKNLPFGSENILNAQESIYYSFYSRLYEAIGPIWQSKIREVPYRRRVAPGEYSTIVDVILDGHGNLIGVRTLQSSGIAEFDNAVDVSWKKIGNFPNPPTALLNELGQVHTGWTFSVQVGQGFNLEYMPPERTY